MADATVTVEFQDCTPPEEVTTPAGKREVFTRIRAVASDGTVLLNAGADHYLTDVEKEHWTAKLLAQVKEAVGGGETGRVPKDQPS